MLKMKTKYLELINKFCNLSCGKKLQTPSTSILKINGTFTITF